MQMNVGLMLHIYIICKGMIRAGVILSQSHYTYNNSRVFIIGCKQMADTRPIIGLQEQCTKSDRFTFFTLTAQQLKIEVQKTNPWDLRRTPK